MFSQVKDKHIEQNFHSVARIMPQGWDLGMLGVKIFSVGICDGAPSTAHSSVVFKVAQTVIHVQVPVLLVTASIYHVLRVFALRYEKYVTIPTTEVMVSTVHLFKASS